MDALSPFLWEVLAARDICVLKLPLFLVEPALVSDPSDVGTSLNSLESLLTDSAPLRFTASAFFLMFTPENSGLSIQK